MFYGTLFISDFVVYCGDKFCVSGRRLEDGGYQMITQFGGRRLVYPSACKMGVHFSSSPAQEDLYYCKETGD
jgi:hypothetical protein